MPSDSIVFLVDTNVLLYRHDLNQSDKQARANTIIQTLTTRHTGALSTQILGEFYAAGTRKPVFALTPAQAEAVVTAFAESWWVYDVTPLVVMEAMRGAQRYGFPYWDAVIWATARLNMVPYVLSEDGNDGAVIEGVRYLNPFNPAFDVSLLQGNG